ncbi:MAG: hypothetical protein K1X28_00410 [Parachlamydiales bacterium]|nr:hypothetical protein [Parachlamydiales bacterium]
MISYLLSLILAASPSAEAPSGVRTMPVPRTPESSTIILKIALPQEGQVVGTPVWVQFRIDGFALGAPSQFERTEEVAVSKLGQTVHVVIDDHPYFPINEPAIDPFDEAGNFYNTSYKFEIPFRLSQGMHTIRMFPARSFGESLKGENTFAVTQFYVGSMKNNPQMDLTGPYLTYNEPSALTTYQAGKPVLLDFYLVNTELSPDGYKVRLTIDGKVNRLLNSWQPYYIYGLKPGRHTVRLELIDDENKVVPGLFNDVSQTITVQ